MTRNDERILLSRQYLHAYLQKLCRRSAVGVVLRLCFLVLLTLMFVLFSWEVAYPTLSIRIIVMMVHGIALLLCLYVTVRFLVRVIESVRFLRKGAFVLMEDVIVREEPLTLLRASKGGYRPRAEKTRYTFSTYGTMVVRTSDYSLFSVGAPCYLLCCVGLERFPLLGRGLVLTIFSPLAHRPTDEDRLRFLQEKKEREAKVTEKTEAEKKGHAQE